LHQNQYGFRNGLGTNDAIARLTAILMDRLDGGEKCLGVFIDLSKAFDSISHIKLLDKLRGIGITDAALSWFSTYLKDRPQMVRINGALSDPQSTDYGIPQGTVIGPVLFLIYVDEIMRLPLSGELVSYADDTVLVVGGSSWSQLNGAANCDINLIKKCFDNNLLSINIEKTNYVVFSLGPPSDEKNVNIVIHNCGSTDTEKCKCSSIKEKECVKYLGIIVDRNLKWKEQIETTVKRLRKIIYILLKLRNIVNVKILRMIYFALAQSVLQYGLIGWGGTYKANLRNVEITQRLLLKIILKRPSDYSTKKLFNEINVMTLAEMFDGLSIRHILKNIENREVLTHSAPRIGRCLKLPKYKTSAAQQHFIYRGIRVFNGLPREIRDEKDNMIINKKIKEMCMKVRKSEK
jgi:hypothetical protein